MSLLVLCNVCFAKDPPKPALSGPYCDPPKLDASYYLNANDKTAEGIDLPSVTKTVEQALKCYQALSGGADPTHPKGLPKLGSVTMDFKTTTGKSAGISVSFFIFKVGASKEKDVTDDVAFKYSVPKALALTKTGPALVARNQPVSFFEQLVNDIKAAADAAQTQSQVLGMPLSNVTITVSYGIKIDLSAGVSFPISLVTLGGNGDYNKNNTQTLALSFGQ